MAADMVAVMKALGFPRFRLAGHDRGGRVSHRLALDHPQAVEKLAVLDIIPTRTLFETVNQQVATGYYHRSEEHTSELQSLMRISYAVFCLKKKKKTITHKPSK